MGMFDSIMVEIEETEVEMQTKLFDNVLSYYHPGDVVSGSVAGISVYFDIVHLDKDKKNVYAKEEAEKTYTVFIILVNGVFTDYVVEQDEWQDASIVKRIIELREKWSDTALVMTRWLDFISNKQYKIQQLHSKINTVYSVISDAKQLEAGEELFKLLKSEEAKRLEKGEDALDVIKSVLDEKSSNSLWEDKPEVGAALKQYRL